MPIRDEHKTKEQLIGELSALRRQIGELEAVHREGERTAAALRESQEQYRSLVESAGGWMWEVDQEAIYTYVSPRVRDMLGYEPEEVIGKTPFDLMPGEEAQRMAEAFGEMAEAARPFAQLEKTNIHKNGREVVLETSGVPIIDAAGNLVGYRGIDRDITARKRGIRAEEQLETAREIEAKNAELAVVNDKLKETMKSLLATQRRVLQSEKLAALGGLMAGVGHELNNPIMGILNYVQYCDERTGEDDPRHDRLVKAMGELHRCQRILEALRSYAHGSGDVDRPESEQVDCRTLIRETVELLAQDLGQSDIQITVDAPENLPAVWTDGSALRQILLNLLTNARDALADRERKEITVTAKAEDGWVAISVADSGCGMSEEVMNRLFDPFFTTKPVGEGTGLGMSVSQNLARRIGAQIEVESQVNEGTVLTVHLPIDGRTVAGAEQPTGTDG